MEPFETHRWVQQLGFSQVIVSGNVKTVPLVCSSCLCQSSSSAASEPCDHLMDRTLERANNGRA